MQILPGQNIQNIKIHNKKFWVDLIFFSLAKKIFSPLLFFPDF